MDRFGRHVSTVKVRRETKRSLREVVGIELTKDGHIDMEDKKIRNLGDPVALNDAVPMHFVQDHCLVLPKEEGNSVSIRGHRLSNVGTPVELTDAVNKQYADYTFPRFKNTKEDHRVIDAQDSYTISVKDPYRVRDVANKRYVNNAVIPLRAINNSYYVKDCRISRLAAPIVHKDAVNLDFMLNNTVSLQGTFFNASGRLISNLTDGALPMDAVNVRQIEEIKRYVKRELYTLAKVLQMRVDKLLSYIYKLHVHKARASLGSEEAELKVTDNTETRALIDVINKDGIEKDWRTVWKEDEIRRGGV